MRLISIVFSALFVFVLGGCANQNAITNYGNFIPSTSTVDQEKIADNAVQQLLGMYLPARTALELKQPTPDPFGQALVRSLRDKGYALMEYIEPKENDQGATAQQTDTAATGKGNATAQQAGAAAQQTDATAATGGQYTSTKTTASDEVTTAGKGKTSKKKQHNRKRRSTPVEEAPVQPIVPPPPPQHVTLQYVLDQIDTDLYRLILTIGEQSISRVYSANGMPAGSWIRKE